VNSAGFFYRLRIFCMLISLCSVPMSAQTSSRDHSSSALTIEKIMRDPKWIGTSPNRIFWSEDGKWVYFNWNPEKAMRDSLYKISRDGGVIQKVNGEERLLLSGEGDYNRTKTEKVYEKDGDIYILEINKNIIRQITNTLQRESRPRFTHDNQKIVYVFDNNLYMVGMKDGLLRQLTDFRKEKSSKYDPVKAIDQNEWLKGEENDLIRVLRERKANREFNRENREKEKGKKPKSIYIEDKQLQNVQLSPDERYITFILGKQPKNSKRTIVPNYITDSAYTEDISARGKVGEPLATYELGIYDIKRDSVYFVSTEEIPGIFDIPSYMKEHADSSKKEQRKPRSVMFSEPVWSEEGNRAVLVVTAQDHKDRWIMTLEPDSAKMILLDRQHDDAWIGGPGIGGWYRGNIGWMPDNKSVWFQSEETGFSHLYSVDVLTGEKRALTRGSFEIYSPVISRSKKYWYFSSNEIHPGERHFYRMAIQGGKPVRIMNLTGSNQVILSPDEKVLAIRHSVSNRPWELYLMENRSGAKPVQITQSLSDEFLSYPWREPEVVTFQAEDGKEIYARLYQPDSAVKNNAAVLFVHGAGYLQNAHKWWSSYFREYMFNNLLVDEGYTVLDLDYRGSAGYGRDWRTGIYRHMGGKDLTDHVDGAKFLVEFHGIDPERIGIYGGSYGGFITLMALFTKSEIFSAGAALRPVTDWAHYNHGYTSDILNIPYSDSTAYRRSSPIYFAEGFQGALLICHGMIDTNVHFQDVVRLAQRLIELGKENWEVAIYPLEGHGFLEPCSWTDEYKRIFKLFEENLNTSN
jgi:dipeptidyl aminopeptidase/acylaminoacyl peptidase